MVQRATIGKRRFASRPGLVFEKERARAIWGIRMDIGEFVRQKERGRSTAGSNATW